MTSSPSHIDNKRALSTLPDPADLSFDALTAWVEQRVETIKATNYSAAILESFRPLHLNETPPHPMGAEADPLWRRFFLAALVADWASYDRSVDRIDYARLKTIMTSAHRFFRVWGFTDAAGDFLPAGYTAWYPISSFIFESASQHANEISDRGAFLPLRSYESGPIDCAYILNISLAAPLRGTPCSTRMVRAFHEEKKGREKTKLMAVTVDAAGHKLSRLTGMKKIGQITVQGESESLYASGMDR